MFVTQKRRQNTLLVAEGSRDYGKYSLRKGNIESRRETVGLMKMESKIMTTTK